MLPLRLAASLIALAGLMACASPGEAQSPAYAGRWRVMQAFDPAAGSGAASSLLRTGVIFREGAVVAQAALRCLKPELEEAPVELPQAFGGVFGGAFGAGAPRWLKALGFAESVLPALRVSCDGARRDYYATPNDELLTMAEGRLLLLRRDETSGEAVPDDEAFIARREASFDCGRATSAIERIVCDFPAALAADADMGRAFARLRKELSKPQADALLASQRTFNDYVRKACRTEGALPRHGDMLRTAASCVASATRDRADVLMAAVIESADGLRVEPLLITQAKLPARASGASWITHDTQPVLMGAPPQVAAFARSLRGALRLPQPLIADRKDLDGSVMRTCRVESLSRLFISLRCTERVQAGTAVPDLEVALNFDLEAGRAVALDDIFTRTGDWAKAVGEALAHDLNHPDGFESLREEILAGRQSEWTFGKQGARVTWKGEGGGPGEVADIPLDVLRPYLKATSPWKP